MELSFLGGAYEVGASSILININGKNILLDSGIRQGAAKDPLPDFRTIQEKGGVDAIMISHAHMDHTGSLPIISKEYPNAKIYMNNMTKDLVRVLLYDSLKIMNNREAEIPLYAEIDVQNMLDRVFTINYQVEFPIFDNITITFYNAGHIAGASLVYIKSKEGALFYSGDFSLFSQRTVEGAKVPKLRPDAAIFEATYGDKLHSNRELEEERLINIVNQCVVNKGKMLIPAFALGRAQEIILILKKAINKGQLKKVNIYVDGMIRNINSAYKFNPLYLKNSLGKKILRGIEPFYDDYIKPIEKPDEREEIFKKDEPIVIISSSGMLTGGPSLAYAEKIASMENGYIVITGYQDEESPGRKLLNLLEAVPNERVLEINSRSIPIKCSIERVGLSAHGDKSEIKALINMLAPKNVFLVHGNGEIIENLGRELIPEIRVNVFIPKLGDSYNININNPRKQWKKEFQQALKMEVELCGENIKDLWKFIRENYGEKLFTVEELMYLWSGSNKHTVSSLEKLQDTILKSSYFETDNKRLFLFKGKSEEDVLETLAPKELKPNELSELVEKHFKEYNYKKSGFIYAEKKVILNFDFPRAVSSEINKTIEIFEEETSWKVEINNALNTNKAEQVIREILKDADIKKISFRGNAAAVTLNSSYNITNEEEKFKEITGCNLEILTKGTENINEALKGNIQESSGSFKMEQNQSLSYIDEAFREEEFKPYKKGIKNNHLGQYIELSFITPIIGIKYKNKIEEIAHKTGWNIFISNSSNMNEIINIVCLYCREEGIALKKKPSFNQVELTVTLKVENGSEEALQRVKEKSERKTGCKVIV
ncbi:putative metal-dependent RNase [Clostridium pascui]|uniref:MBL fold metallo-hydrolase n=1 Tax=Clostridium pascui TaxID=46609 RepID=UPI00195F1E1F|nr:MBL fold metallo-hydrolase [Clostridium pascui]MBM7871010.1 putative metal-dependent RNase [Clostridium pascui]